ncbi:MAG TPA: Crp/Fnr family transcriptional regulator [Terriglobales bacterium]|nr:Crp/Fnr family transcriptional regulator [Terriglobales bacterium]
MALHSTPVTPVTDSLLKTQLFSGLTPAERESLSKRAVRKRYKDGERLFTEGDKCDGLFVVSKGAVRIFKSAPNGREQVLAVEGPGSSIAELPVFDGGDYPASANAVGETEAVFISRQAFQAFCLEHPQVALKVLAVVGSRLRRLVAIVEELSFTTVRQRVIALLVRMAEAEGKRTARGIQLSLKAGHQEIAFEIGTVRELVSRNLARLQAEGLIEVDGREVLVKDLAALEAQQKVAS